MGLLRSEAMKYGMLVLPVAQARKYVNAIGQEAFMEFEDMNAHEMRRPYRKYIQRIDECERILRYLYEELGNLGCPITANFIDEYFEADAREEYKFDNVEVELKTIYDLFVSLKSNGAMLKEEKNQAREEAYVVANALGLLRTLKEEDSSTPLLDASDRRVQCVAGVIPQADQWRFNGAVFRASRGNAHTSFTEIPEPIEDPKTGVNVEKSIFRVFFQGSASTQSAMKDKIVKVCAAFGVNMYEWPASAQEALTRKNALTSTARDKELLLDQLNAHMMSEGKDLVKELSGNSRIEDIRLFCAKEKTIYHTLNLFEGDMLLRVHVWYAECEEQNIKDMLTRVAGNSKETALLKELPFPKKIAPTYIKVNDFTGPWQDVINTYGIPRYQEVNPALFSVVTFPFIFGMMYGDIGHGSMLLVSGLLLVWKGEQFKYTMSVAFESRYMILQLGIYAVFAGFMYSDLFSVGPSLFESKWKRNPKDPDGEWLPQYDINNEGGEYPYPFGVDPAWIGATNSLIYMNSMKMKLSVLMGVLQMTVGVFLRFANSIYFKSVVDLLFECVPMLIFMVCFFGWMDFMILYKWVYVIDTGPPSVINSLICMAMAQEDKEPLWGGSLPSNILASKLMLCAVISVPWMLFPKPFILAWLDGQQKKKKAAAEARGEELLDEEAGGGGGHGHGEEFAFGEVFIHQIIETIEYVLGTVSHTASYLRIWALSLAHQQLSEVFFSKTIGMGFSMCDPVSGIGPMWGGVVIYLMFGAWLGVTLGVLLGMDVMECFLHTLRLHWVEFQSKFYKADGVLFAPYRIKEKLIAQD